MSRSKISARWLLALALFQLVGGPAVLCGVMLFAKLMGTHSGRTSERTVDVVVAHTLQSPRLASFLQAEGSDWLAEIPKPWPQGTPSPTKGGKDGKSKFVAVIESLPPAAIFDDTPPAPLVAWCAGLAGQWAQAPPGPPPRMSLMQCV